MKTFLLNNESMPVIKWSHVPENHFFEGPIPENYHLAVAPTWGTVILDVDFKKGKNGYKHIPENIKKELDNTFNYKTKSGGAHYFIEYTGKKTLMNRATTIGLDLRIGKHPETGLNGGYVKWNYHKDVRECISLIKKSSVSLNSWLEKLFA